METATDDTSGPAPRSDEEEPERSSRLRVVLFVLLGVLMICAYIASVLAYRQSIDQKFVPPQPAPDEIAVVLVPTGVFGQQQTVEAEVLLFPGASYLDGDALKQDLSVAVAPTVESGELVFPAGSAPVPQKVVLPAAGVIEKYPFDTYRLRSTVKVETGDATATVPELTPVTAQYTTYFNTPGWSLDPTAESGGQEFKALDSGVISRSAPTITIAVIFILLILAFGVLAVSIEVAVLRGRYRPEISTASWLTAALFALISLRNGLPGSPPLGSWMDILVYFWVIAAVMIITVATVSLILKRSAAAIHAEKTEESKASATA